MWVLEISAPSSGFPGKYSPLAHVLLLKTVTSHFNVKTQSSFPRFIYVLFYVSEYLFAWMHVLAHLVFLKRAPDFLDMELHMIISQHVGAANQMQGLCKGNNCSLSIPLLCNLVENINPYLTQPCSTNNVQ